MDKVPPKDVIHKIKVCAKSVDGVEHVTDVKGRFIGSFLYIDLHISVSDTLNLKKAATIAEKVEHLLIDKIPLLKEVNAIIS